MKKTLLTTIILLLSLNVSFAQCDVCKEVLKPNYDVFSSVTDKEYLVSLNTLYESSESQYNEKKNSEGYNVIIPDYGSLDYKKNKSKINRFYNTYKEQIDLELTDKEQIEILSLTIDKDVRIKMLSEFTKCIALCNNGPSSESDFINENTVIITIFLPISIHTSGKKTKIKNIITSDGLKLRENNEVNTGDKLRYGESYSFAFDRENKKQQSIIIDLKKEDRIYFNIPKINDDPVYEWTYVSVDNEGNALKFTSDVINIIPENKEITISSRLARIKTQIVIEGGKNGKIDLLMSSDKNKINDINIRLIKGSIKPHTEEIIIEGNKLFLKYDLMSNIKTKTQVEFIIYYSVLKKVCIKNCD